MKTSMKIPETARTHSATFLNHAELCDLTGWKTAKKQREKLREQGIPFHKNARGYPRVVRETLIGKPKTQAATTPSPSWQPNIHINT